MTKLPCVTHLIGARLKGFYTLAHLTRHLWKADRDQSMPFTFIPLAEITSSMLQGGGLLKPSHFIYFNISLYQELRASSGRSLNHSCLIMILLLNFFLIIGFCFKFHFFHFLSRAFLHISITDQFSKMVNSLFPTLWKLSVSQPSVQFANWHWCQRIVNIGVDKMS